MRVYVCTNQAALNLYKHATAHHRTGTGIILRLPDTRLKEKVRATLDTDARLEERLERVALARERVDDVRTGLDERRLEHVAEQAEDGVKRLELLRLGLVSLAVLDTREELREDREIEDEGRREQRVLALVEDRDGAAATAHDLRIVLVDRTLRVADSGHVLDDDEVVRVLALGAVLALREHSACENDE